jgi:hypothetical protein
MEGYGMVRRLPEWSPMGKRSRGHPRSRRKDEVLKDIKGTGCEKQDKGGDVQIGPARSGREVTEGCRTKEEKDLLDPINFHNMGYELSNYI